MVSYLKAIKFSTCLQFGRLGCQIGHFLRETKGTEKSRNTKRKLA